MKTPQQHQHPENYEDAIDRINAHKKGAVKEINGRIDQLATVVDPQLLAKAHRAIRLLETRKKSVIKEHSERTKRLRNAVDALVTSALDPDDMMTLPVTLAPELIALIENPEEGL